MVSTVRLALLGVLLVQAESNLEPRSSLQQPMKWFQRLRRPKGKIDRSAMPLDELAAATTTSMAETVTQLNEHTVTSNEISPYIESRTSSIATAALTSILQSTDLAKLSLTGLQFLLGWYLVKGLWKAATDVLEDLQLEQNGGNENPILASNSIKQALQDLQANKWNESPTYGIASKLQQAGIPLFNDSGKSVESILLGLTKTEMQLMQISLYTPPSYTPHQLWTQIKGLENVQDALLNRISSMRFCPDQHPYAGVLGASSPGILLYGPPGCGKSLLIQALATTARMPCLMITPSTLLRKYVGETNILVRALWKLAEKLSPCIMLLDELDGLFRERRGDEHDVSRESKTEFLQWWDGVSKHNQEILVVGATNRPFDVDAAVLRRMPQSYFCGFPMAPARLEILQALLQKIPHESMDLSGIVGSTEGYSPSDLVQIMQTAVQSGPLREARYQKQKQGYRPLVLQDLINARQSIGPTPFSAEYRRALIEYTQRHNTQQISQSHSPQNLLGGMQDAGEWGTFYHAGTFEAELDDAIVEDDPVESDLSEYDSHDETDGFDADL